MNATSPETTSEPQSGGREATRAHLRGSSLFLVGRVVSVALNFVVQILTVRYLTRQEFGSFAYALTIASLGSSIAVFGLDKSVTRFVPIYQEQKDTRKVLGTLLMMTATVVFIGMGLVLLVVALHDEIGARFLRDRESAGLLAIIIGLAPANALISLFLGMVVTFGKPREVFFPKHLLGPLLHIAVVALLIALNADVYFLAAGYVATGVLTVIVYAVLLWRLLVRDGWLRDVRLRTMARALQMPFRDVFGFTVPLLVSDLAFVMRTTLLVVLLEQFQGASGVAGYRAVLPVARLNQVVLQSFALLFTPVSARLFARNDREGINHLYWQTAAWIAVASFPLFIFSFSLAKPLTLLLFGARYADSAALLAILTLGHYFNAALGFNVLTLRVYGRVRYLFLVELVAFAACLGGALVLIPRFGALGAAAAASGTLVLQNLAYQYGLRRDTGIAFMHRGYVWLYVSVAAIAGGLLLLDVLTNLPVAVAFALALILSAGMLRAHRRVLDIENTFPELLRLPGLRRFLG